MQTWRIIGWAGIASFLASEASESLAGLVPFRPLDFMLSDSYILPLFFALLIALRDKSSERLATLFGFAVSLACVVAIFVDLPWGDPWLIERRMEGHHRSAVLAEGRSAPFSSWSPTSPPCCSNGGKEGPSKCIDFARPCR